MKLLENLEEVSYDEIFRSIGKVVVACILAVAAVIVTVTVATGLLTFASSGIGAVILCFIGYRLYKSNKQ